MASVTGDKAVLDGTPAKISLCTSLAPHMGVLLPHSVEVALGCIRRDSQLVSYVLQEQARPVSLKDFQLPVTKLRSVDRVVGEHNLGQSGIHI